MNIYSPIPLVLILLVVFGIVGFLWRLRGGV